MPSFLQRLLLVLTFTAAARLAAAPAPAPILLSPADAATNVGLDPSLTWGWRDELIVNGGFGTVLSAGWTVWGLSPRGMWKRVVEPPNDGLAEADLSFSRLDATTLTQIVTLPADTTSALFGWLERLPPSGSVPPGMPSPGLRADVTDGQTVLETLHESNGDEPEFQGGGWAARIADLTAYAGQTVYLRFRAWSSDRPAGFYARVDGVSLRVERTDLPTFDLYLGTSLPLGPANLIAQVNALSHDLNGLPANTRHCWQVGAVRDGVTNLSRVFSFTTEQIAPTLTVVSLASDRVTIRFDTRVDRSYTVQQADSLSSLGWTDGLPGAQGTGSPMTLELPLASSGQAFLRVRVDP